jgi:hypothetical protein
MEIRSKRQFYDLWKSGCLGNRPQTWSRVEDAVKSGATNIGFREVGKAGGGEFELVRREDATQTAEEWKRAGRAYSLDGACPNERTELQGAVCRTVEGWEGDLAIRSGTDIRAAMSLGLIRSYSGLIVSTLLDHFMDPSSRDDVEMLLEMFPNATIEFSCFPCDVGVIPNRNTVIWEVRDY